MGIIQWVKRHWQVNPKKNMVCPKCGKGNISKGNINSNILIERNALYCNVCKYPVNESWVK